MPTCTLFTTDRILFRVNDFLYQSKLFFKIITMKTKSFFLITFFLCSLQLFSQIPQKPLLAKPVIKAPVAKKIVSRVPNADTVRLQKAVVNIVVGDDGKDKDSKLSIAINVTSNNQNHLCAYYGTDDVYLEPISSGAYSPGEDVTIPTNLYAGIAYISGAGLPAGEQKMTFRQAVFSDFDNGGDIELQFETTHDIWKIKSLTASLFFDNDPVTPYKITWTNIQLSQDPATVILQFDKNFNPIQSPVKNVYQRKTNLGNR
jgi:hypothetical protein